ncbi:V-type proton ATPase subunit G 1 [Sesamum angolense]|uniref:V-type proton ATPase subunit G 1 n=1 Tax=Sesamum angolense TaxID=2727404 RepID=A0AAE1W2N2_9LAMI|nr:V-type proton ATPase subunit G 1 [Sesamum angolense]
MDSEILVMEYGDLMGFNDDDDSRMNCFVLCWLEQLTVFVWVDKGTVEEFSVVLQVVRYGSNVTIMWFMGFSTVQGYGWVLAAHGVSGSSSNNSCGVILSHQQSILILLFGRDSSSSQNGIQLLLAAEQEAQHIVNAARTAKQARLKQAKEEAEREIAEFRAQVEAEFQRKLAGVFSVICQNSESPFSGSIPNLRGIYSSGDSGANVKRLEVETDEKIQHLKTEASRISPDVVSMLLRHVTTVKN